MSTHKHRSKQFPARLHNGDQLKREEFHRRYCDMPENYRAELIGGIVFEPSPVSYIHGKWDNTLGYLLKTYSIATPGTGVASNATLILSDEDEVQPDLMLRITDEFGGQSRETAKHFIAGAPELVAEIAYSSQAIDLHWKKQRYALAGVTEYLVVCLHPEKIFWFNLQTNEKYAADTKGILRSIVFPGLWIDEKGLLKLDDKLTTAALGRGLKSPAHKSFAARNRK